MTDSGATTHHRIEIWKCRWFSTLDTSSSNQISTFYSFHVGSSERFTVATPGISEAKQEFCSNSSTHQVSSTLITLAWPQVPQRPRVGTHTHIHSQQEKAWHTLPWEPEKNIPPWGKTGNSTIFWGDMFFPLENYSNLLVWTKFFYPNSNRIPIFLGATQFFVFISEDLNMIRGSTTSNTWVLENSWKGRPLHRWSWWIWVETHS